jgi:hypothetical protein
MTHVTVDEIYNPHWAYKSRDSARVLRNLCGCRTSVRSIAFQAACSGGTNPAGLRRLCCRGQLWLRALAGVVRYSDQIPRCVWPARFGPGLKRAPHGVGFRDEAYAIERPLSAAGHGSPELLQALRNSTLSRLPKPEVGPCHSIVAGDQEGRCSRERSSRVWFQSGELVNLSHRWVLTSA